MRHTEVSIQRDWIDLQLGDSLSLRRAAGQSLRIESARAPASPCSDPCLWLTEEGQPEDVFLRDGEAYVVRGSGRVVMTVWRGTARVRLNDAAAPRPQPARPSSRSIQSASAWATACGASAMRL
ncbi:DUF2917 domain-containing protein [Thiomonas intermedia]|uniref:DUF2917 domain-containing protein n=1 Tax=Thiomonas intermedia TaxID=926 RepID=UPI0009A5184A|nr:DUF2917 domain-containing protein [Thiomonas intermedia]